MQEHLGSVIFSESRAHLTELGRIIPCAYYSLVYGIDGEINEASAYDIAYNEHITESKTFHEIVARLCKKSKKEEGDGTLVLVDREALGWKLEEAVRNIGLSAHFIFGKTPQRRREEVLQAFERREIDVLIGGKIINRGLDLKGGCESLILATGGKLQSDFIQKVGRALRRNRHGKSRIYDFFFRCNRYLYDHSKARLKAMIRAGYPTTVVFPGGGIDGAELVRSRFQIKRKLLVPQSRAT
jgi:superfamily II DNA or RNA helicase